MKPFLIASLFLAATFSSSTAQICNIHCDGRDPAQATSPREPVSTELFSRVITLVVSDVDNMGFARIENGDPDDEVWLDRSFDGGNSWVDGSRLGAESIPTGSRTVSTRMYNVDDAPGALRFGALRACGKAGDRPEVGCTSWARSTVGAETRADAAALAMMQFYNSRGLWSTTGWWNSANCLTTLIDYIRISGSNTYRYAINKTFEDNKGDHYGNFTNEYIDDTLWWGLAFVLAYDLTGEEKYLEMAKFDSDFSYEYKDDVCGGGLWWTDSKTYKNAIPNELFIKLSASLHNRIPGDTKYLAQAIEVWDWFRASGMINSDNLINDGLTSDCRNNGDITWTYNQGVILGGLVELYKATSNSSYIQEALDIANAAIRSDYLNDANGILREPCEAGGGDCGGDGPSFKGIFMRNLGELNRILLSRPFRPYILRQADAIYNNSRNSLNQLGLYWAGPFDKADGARQHSAFDALVAAHAEI